MMDAEQKAREINEYYTNIYDKEGIPKQLYPLIYSALKEKEAEYEKERIVFGKACKLVQVLSGWKDEARKQLKEKEAEIEGLKTEIDVLGEQIVSTDALRTALKVGIDLLSPHENVHPFVQDAIRELDKGLNG